MTQDNWGGDSRINCEIFNMYPLMIMHYEIVNQNYFAPLRSFLLENNDYLKFGNFSQTQLDQLISSFTQALTDP